MVNPNQTGAFFRLTAKRQQGNNFDIVDQSCVAEPGGHQQTRGTVKCVQRPKIGVCSQFQIFHLPVACRKDGSARLSQCQADRRSVGDLSGCCVQNRRELRCSQSLRQ